jgi:hypothetical protein
MMERELEYWAPGATEPRPIRVTFGAPEPHPKYEWSCSITITGFEKTYTKQMYQVDPVGATIAAMAITPYLLRSFAGRGGRLTFRGSAEIDFPTLLSRPEYTCQFARTDGTAPRKVSVRVNHPERIDESWSVLVVCIDQETWECVERRVQGDTWATALQRAAATVPELLQEYVDKAGGGVLEEVDDAPACGIPTNR